MSLGNFVLKTLDGKIKTKRIIESEDLFEVIGNMGLDDNDIEVLEIIEHLETENVDINFKEGQSSEYNRFKRIKHSHQIMRRLKIKRDDVKSMMTKVESITPPERPKWLEVYRSDDEEEDKGVAPETFEEVTQRIRNVLDDEMRRQAEIRGEEVMNEVRQLTGDITGEGF